jgi:hypothetical protein
LCILPKTQTIFAVLTKILPTVQLFNPFYVYILFNIQFFTSVHYIIGVYFVFKSLVVVQPRRPLAYNIPAAWRRRGFHCRSDGNETSKLPQTFGRATAPLAPNRPLAAGLFVIVIFSIRLI